MNIFSFLIFALRMSSLPWHDLALREIESIRMQQHIAAERLAITARFKHSKALAMADLDIDSIDETGLDMQSRIDQLRLQGQDEQADLVAQLEAQAKAEEAWAAVLSQRNATLDLSPDHDPAAVPAPSLPPPMPGAGTAHGTPVIKPAPKPVVTPPPAPKVIPKQPAAIAPVATGDMRFLLSIPKLGLTNVPVIESNIQDTARFMNDLKSGVAHAFCHPGEPCKDVIFGHSSGFASDSSPYKRVFARLNELAVGDQIVVNDRGKRYTYVVFKKAIVAPDAMEILRNYEWEELTLFTCWPINTWQKRLVVYTKRLS